MRVTLVSPFDPTPGPAGAPERAHVGGVERVFRHVSRELARRGHEVTLVCSSERAAPTTVEEGVRVVRARRHLTVLRAPVAWLSRHLLADSDVVHVAATYPFTTPRVLKRARRLGVPSVLDFHFEPAPGTGLGRLAAGLYGRVGPRSYRWADAVLVRSLSYGRTAPSLARVPEDRWRVIPNGVDTHRFHPNGSRGTGDYLLFVGRLVPYKGLDVLLRALARRPPGLPLLVAGDGPLRPTLEALARRLGVDARFLGHVPDADLPALYQGARATILPSVTQQEAFGLALLESMACGTPVVASQLPGVEEVARLGGLVAPPGDIDALAEAVARVVRDELPRGPALAARVREAYSWEAVTDRLLEVYAEVAGRAPPPSHPEVMSRAHPRRDAVL
jgi:glycosyltransferase involved in cell wall biosynthesis